jgi:hypothetical protein
MTKPIKDFVEDLKYGDPLWCKWNGFTNKSIYAGRDNVLMEGEYLIPIKDVIWSRRVTLWQKIKEIFKR